MRSIIFFALFATVFAQQKYRFCAPNSINPDICNAVQRGESRVTCLPVSDSVDCAIRLARNEADFGIFTAEEALLAYQFYQTEIQPIYQLRHKDRLKEEFEFQSVAVIPKTLDQTALGKNFEGLKHGGLCHPGFSKAQWWNDYILKYFEKKVSKTDCRADLTAAENEAENLKAFFGKSCRPGEWVSESSFDSYLKTKYPELCALCDNPKECEYNSKINHGHTAALECLTAGRGAVAYVALDYVRQHLKANDSYQFLCPNGSTEPLTAENPCAWIRQPWSIIAASRSRAAELTKDLKKWLVITYAGEPWTIALSKLLQEDSVAQELTENMSLATYLGKGRTELDLPNIPSCGNALRWCAISAIENTKCQWVAKEALALGIEPKIECKLGNSTFQCFRDISENRADLMTIDSNYGYLARMVYNLATILYSETENDRNSMVVAIVRAADPVKSFDNLKGRKACFPEYGGIAWLSFVKTARVNGIISSKSCNYPKHVANLLSGACTPGIKDRDHSNRTVSKNVLKEDVTSKLCSLCPLESNNMTCSANKDNRYYGDRGALKCLSEKVGDIAFIEATNLIDGTIDRNMYQILCKNGSLAMKTGFDFDDYCALSVTIDSEVIGRRNNSKIDTMDMTLALLKIEDWLGYRVNARRPIRIYNVFNGTADLLFKDSTAGLVTTTSTIKSVFAYKELFSHVEACSGVSSIINHFGMIILLSLVPFLFRNG